MHIIAVGLNHKTAPIEIRERLAFAPHQLAEALQQLMQSPRISEATILSTCNRTEIYAVAHQPDEAVEDSERFLREFNDCSDTDLAPHLYRILNQQCVEHLFRVACGVDSMVVGESQILAQVKHAFDAARKGGATRVILDELFRRALNVGKRARTETDISTGALSVGSAAVELAKTIFGKLNGRTILILGAGKMSELTSKHLVDNGATSVIVANRTHDRAVELADRFHGQAIRYESFPEHLKNVDIVISSTSAPHFVVRVDTVTHVMRARRDRPLFLIDIAVPRDIDPEVNKIDNVFLYDIDDIQSVVAANRAERDNEVHRVETITEHEVADFMRWFKGLEVQPIIAALSNRVEEIRKQEVERLFGRLSHLSARDREVVQTVVKGVAQKIIHDPIVRLRESAELGNGYVDAEVVRRIFNLESMNGSKGESDDV